MTKSAPQEQAGQKRGNQLSLNARVNAVFMLAWISDGMEESNGAIAKVANANIVLESSIQKT